jgi:hypothetical protein
MTETPTETLRAIAVLEERGYVVMTEAQWGGVVDALGPASDDVLDLIFDDDG